MKLNFVNEMCELKGQYKGVDFRFVIHEAIDTEQNWLEVDALFRIPDGRLYRYHVKISAELMEEDNLVDLLCEHSYPAYERIITGS